MWPVSVWNVAAQQFLSQTYRVEEGYWQRVGQLRAKLRARGRKARFGDAFIAQP
jgi:hypothetical protein